MDLTLYNESTMSGVPGSMEIDLDSLTLQNLFTLQNRLRVASTVSEHDNEIFTSYPDDIFCEKWGSSIDSYIASTIEVFDGEMRLRCIFTNGSIVTDPIFKLDIENEMGRR